MRKQSARARGSVGAAAHAFDDVQAMVVFARVIQERSFTRAARQLGTTTSAVSKRIARLEQRAGARLLVRTTRHVSPTETGVALYDRCLRILREVEDAELLVAGMADAPRGLLRISAPVYLGELYIAPLIGELLGREPELRVELVLSDRFVDLAAEGFDLAVRVGTATGASLTARRLARTKVVACASPQYLERRGRPRTPRDLLEHDCLRYSLDPMKGSWRFQSPSGEPLTIPVTGSVDCNHGGALREAAIAGRGIVFLPLFYLTEALARGALVRILDEFCRAEIAILGVHPAGRLVPPKTRVCVEWLAQELPARLSLDHTRFERSPVPGQRARGAAR
jgi:DNA-binding transcriptional LysR family regulator